MAKRFLTVGTMAFCLLLIAPTFDFAQEIDPLDPFFLANGVDRAHLIVVGTFRVKWFFPWFDGWHYSGAPHIEEVLHGGRTPAPPIEFLWKESYGATCMVCDLMSRINGQRGIWLLANKEGQWRFSGTMATLCGWSLPMNCRRAVEKAVQTKALNGSSQ